MSTVLSHHAYGKSRARMMKVLRVNDGAHDQVRDLSVDIALQGEFDAAYTAGDNRTVIPTDTMKNLVYVLGRDHSLESIEGFALHVGRHILGQYPQVSQAAVTIREHPWRDIIVKNSPHGHAFIGEGGETWCAAAVMNRRNASLESGLEGLDILKTADSAFSDFHRDQWTTLKDASERLLRTIVQARWRWSSDAVDYSAANQAIRTALLETFAQHVSLSAQQTLCAMGQRAMDVCQFIDRIAFSLSNRHCNLVDLSPFGLDNPQMIFIPTDEPHGVIEATIERR